MSNQSEIQDITNKIANITVCEDGLSANQEQDYILPWTQSKLKTGIVFHEDMTKHTCPWIEPDECPQRYQCIYDKLTEYKLLEQCIRIPFKLASEDDVLLVHSKGYFNKIKALHQVKDIKKLKEAASEFDGVYFNEHSYNVAMLSLGASLKLIDEIILGTQIRNGFALIRTPGHHAMENEANGYCIFNNAAIAARHAQTRHSLKRILIIDWDIHHGQGTQSIFYNDPSVLYISIHRYENGAFWPNLRESNFDFIGAGKGKGHNINIPLNDIDCTDGDFMAIWFNLIMPVAYEFDPNLVIVSAGYDAAIGCPEGKMRVLPATFSLLCHSLMALANGKLAVLLEGGYNLLSLAESAAFTVGTLLGHPIIQDPLRDYCPLKSRDSILSAIYSLGPYWNTLSIQATTSTQQVHTDSKSKKSTVISCPFKRDFNPQVVFVGDEKKTSKEKIKYNVDEVVCEKDFKRQETLNKLIKEKLETFSNVKYPQIYPDKKTILLFDDKLTRHHYAQGHPEKPQRYTSILERLEFYGLLASCTIGTSRHATEDELSLTHTRKYIKEVKSITSMSQRDIDRKCNNFDSIYMTKDTFDCACLAAGCVLEIVDKVLTGVNLNGFAIVRPPGHHAGPDYPAGFCIFNNVLVGAKYALNKYPDICKKILIVDFDYHHGDGNQKLVGNDERLKYLSMHAYDNAKEYPFTTLSNFTGGGKQTVNIPWENGDMGDVEYLMAFFAVFLPIAYEFKPDYIFISAGYDAVQDDVIGRYELTPEVFGHFIHHLMPITSGKVIACLEGGYNVRNLGECASYTVSSLLGYPPQRLPPLEEIKPSAVNTLRQVMEQESKYNKLLAFNVNLPENKLDNIKVD